MSAPGDELLRKIPLFRRVSAADRARIAEVAHLKRYDTGELIFREGDPGDTFLTIVEGRVKVFKATRSPPKKRGGSCVCMRKPTRG